MCVFLWLAAVLYYAGAGDGLECMTCYGSSSIDECDATGRIQQCMPNQKSCETVVRRYNGDHLIIEKGCKDTVACKDNQMQNARYSGISTQCNLDQLNSVCTCCCDSSACNVGNPACADAYPADIPAGNDCAGVSPNFPHGQVDCSHDSKPGSLCTYQCTDMNYEIWPVGRDKSICLTNGSWSQEPPCCARPCPPYYLLDDVLMYHFAGDRAEEHLAMRLNELYYFLIGEEEVMVSLFYYSSDVVNSSVVEFNEYGTDINRFVSLAKERVKLQNDGSVNTGAAIKYAMDHLFTQAAGARDKRVPKAIWGFFGNANPGGDFIRQAEEARRRGILIYVVGFETDGFTLDRDQMAELTGDKKHVFISDNTPAVTAAISAEIIEHFCQNPCDHVLHDHE